MWYVHTDLKTLHFGIAPVAVEVMNLQEANIRVRQDANMVATNLIVIVHFSRSIEHTSAAPDTLVPYLLEWLVLAGILILPLRYLCMSSAGQLSVQRSNELSTSLGRYSDFTVMILWGIVSQYSDIIEIVLN